MPGDPEDSELGIRLGACRFFPIVDRQGNANLGPRRGLPKVSTTADLPGLVDQLLEAALSGSATSIRYAPAEGEVIVEPEVDAEPALLVDEYEPDDDEQSDGEDILGVSE